jgi:hypothetical protein
MNPSGLWRRVVQRKTDVLEKVVSIFRDEAGLRLPLASAGLCLFYSSILNMVATCSPETSVTLNGLHVFIPQNIEIFTTTNVRTSNPTFYSCLYGAIIWDSPATRWTAQAEQTYAPPVSAWIFGLKRNRKPKSVYTLQFSFSFLPHKVMNSNRETRFCVMCWPTHKSRAPCFYCYCICPVPQAVIHLVALFPMWTGLIWITHCNNECSCTIPVKSGCWK